MNSLRVRLILGFALVAIVPLAVAMVLLSKRIEATMRAQAADRLETTLGVMQRQWRTEGERTLDKLDILSRDPALRRLYLVPGGGGRELSEYLAEKRVLLGIDFLVVLDNGGNVAGDASMIPSDAAAGGRSAPRIVPGRAGVRGVELVRLEDAPALAMTATAPIRYQSETAGMLGGGLIVDAGFLDRLKQTSGVDLVLRDAAGRTVASTLGRDTLASLPSGTGPALRGGKEPVVLRSFPLEAARDPAGGGAATGRVTLTGLVSAAVAEQTIEALRTTSMFLALWGVAIAIALGVLWSLQISRPVERLAVFAQRIARGEWDEPLALKSVHELEALVVALDRMRRDLHGYREKLVASERHAAWSLMARKVAHEVKNPLTPIAVSVADLKRSYELKRPEFPEILNQAVKTVEEEVHTLKRLLQEFSEFGRFPEPRFTTCRLAELLADLRALYAGEVTEGRLIVRPARDLELTADPAQLRRALVNLVKNGLEAVQADGHVVVTAGVEEGALVIDVSDTGPGLTAEQRRRLFVPDFTTKPHGSGLGLTIVERIVNDHHGTITVDSEPGRETRFRIRLPLARVTGREAAGVLLASPEDPACPPS